MALPATTGFARRTHLIDSILEQVIKEELSSMRQPARLECTIGKYLPFREDFGMNVEGPAGIVTREDR